MKFFTACLTFLLVLFVSISQAQNPFNEQGIDDEEIVVLLHGLARSNAAMWVLNIRLKRAGYHVEPVGYRSLRSTPEEIMQDITRQIDRCCKQRNNTVHFVGHSLGGLLIRKYLQENRVKNLGRVVLMGTPNQGTAVADYFRDKWWAQIAGPTALALGTDRNSFPLSLEDPYYPVGVIAGVVDNNLNEHVLPGQDDGLVSIEATKLKGMSDFVIIKSGHTMMRYNEKVALQAISFLRNGYFDKLE